MQRPDKISVIVLLLAWFALDVVVLTVDKSDKHALEYLTNQVWIAAIVSKVSTAVSLLCVSIQRTMDAGSAAGRNKPP